MFARPLCTSKALPKEYRLVAEELFPPEGFSESRGPSLKATEAFANILGIGEEFRRLVNTQNSGPSAGDFLTHFQNNLDLLIQKTWVEKSDEIRKEDLQDKVMPLISIIEKGNYNEALEEFSAILEELAYLFFGAQSQKDDFAEYALRIDPQMGLFWWYGGQISDARRTSWVKQIEPGIAQALLLLGICYLTDF